MGYVVEKTRILMYLWARSEQYCFVLRLCSHSYH